MPALIDFLRLSLSSIRKRKLRSALTMLGIVIGIAAVVSLISLGDGLRTAITGQFGSLSTDKLTIQNSGTGFGPPGSTSIRKLTSHDVEVIKRVNEVEFAIPRLIRIVKVEYNKASSFRYISTIPESQKETDIIYSSFNAEISEGRLLKSDDSGKIIIGSDLATTEEFGKKIRLDSTLLVQGREFKVVGILKPSSSFIVNSALLMTEKDLKDILKIGDEYDLIVAQVSGNIEQTAGRIEKDLRKDRDEKIGEEDFSVQTPLQAVASVNTVLNIINLIVTGIAAISLIIGGIGIANTMYTSVLERTREIGTMKAIGARNRDILLIFMIESGLLGLVGGIIGALIGLEMAFLVSNIASITLGENIITVSINYSLLLGAIGFSTGIGLLSGLFPARQASKLKPVDALRG